MIQLKINGQIADIPADLTDIKLGQFLQYWDKYGRDFDKKYADLDKEIFEDPFLKELALIEHENAEAVAWYSFFTGFDFSTIGNQDMDMLMGYYRIIRENLAYSEQAAYSFPNSIYWNGEQWFISDWKITPTSSFTFNELLTSKEITRQVYAIGKGKWEALPYLCAVFLRKENEAFADWMVAEGSERLKLMYDLPLDTALQVGFFFNQFSDYAAKSFAVFKSSGGSGDVNLAKHYERWGWVNFLSSIAETKIFDIPGAGMDSIDCAKKANLFKVLMYASEKRDYNVAYAASMK